MIRQCTCTGGSAATLELSRKQGGTASCKSCGGKPLVDGRGPVSGSMLSTVGLELTSVINPDLTWKTVSKGSRSASRRARKSIARGSKGSGDLIDNDPKRVEDMPVSESEKLGVTVLGRRFSDKVEHVPIKKRRFLFRSPSPPPRMPSPCPEESDCLLKSQPASVQDSSSNLIAKGQFMTIDTAIPNELGQVVNAEIIVDRKNLEVINEKLDDNEDFSGISILAAAACNNNIGGGLSEEGLTVEESSVREGSFEVLVNTESCSEVKQSCKEHSLNCPEISNDGTGSCISAIRVEESTVLLGATDSSQKDATMVSNVVDGKNMDSSFFPENPVAVSQNLPSNSDDGTRTKLKSSSHDDRALWDLNTVMDVWESPCDDRTVDCQKTALCGISEDRVHGEKPQNLEVCEVRKEPGDTKHAIKKTVQPMIGRVVSGDAQEDIFKLSDSRRFVPGAQSKREERNVDASAGLDKATCFHEKVFSFEIDNAPNSATGLAEETKPLHNQEIISTNAEAVVSAPAKQTLESSALNTCAVADESASIQCVNFGCTKNSDFLSSHQVVSVDAFSCHSSCPVYPGANHITSKTVPEENRDAASKVHTGKQTGDGCAADDLAGEAICLRSPQAEKRYNTLPDSAISEKASCDMNNFPTEDDVDSDRISGLLVDENVSKKMMSMDVMTGQALPPGPLDNVMGNSVKMDLSQVSLNCEELSKSAASIGKGEPLVADAREEDGKAFVDGGENLNTIEVDSSVHIDSEEFTHRSSIQATGVVDTPTVIVGSRSHDACKSHSDDPVNSFGMVAFEEDPFDDSDYDSDVSQNDPGCAGMEKVSELQAGYDSQYEDGEFREPIVNCWEEDAGDEGEAEHVDYGSDNRDPYGFEAAADYSVSMSIEGEEGVECKTERSEEVDHVDYEGGETEEKNVQETNCQPHVGGPLKRSMDAGSGKERALKKYSREHFERRYGVENCKMVVRVDRELSAGADKVIGDDELCARGDAAEESSQSASSRMKLSGWDQLPEGGCSSADMIMDVRDGSGKNNHTDCRVDVPDAGNSLTSVAGSVTFRRELASCIEGSTSSDLLLKNRVCKLGSRSNNLDDSTPRVERDTGSAKSIGRGGSSLHMHGRGRGSDHWGPNHHQAPNYYGPAGFGHPGPKNAAAAAAAKVESSGFVVAPDGTIVKAGGVGPSGRDRRQSVNGFSPGVHRTLTRKGSPSDRDETFGMHMGLGHVGEMSPDRSISVGRGRSGRYGPRMVGTGPRERYRGPVPYDRTDSSLRMQHPLARRERSFSPIQRREGPPLPRLRMKSRSRSRTRSPHMWPSPRGRNGVGPGFRQHSRSPNFRSDARMDRVRSPHRRPGFEVDHILGFASTPGNRGSPPPTSRWIGERKDAGDHFREHGYKQRSSAPERSSPGRIFPRNHRFDLVDSPGRLKPDEFYRPMHPGRFPEMVGSGRGPRYDGSDDDRRKHSDRYRVVHPVRRYDTDGAVRRFRYDMEDGFVAHNSRNKDATEFHGKGGPRDFDRGIDSRLGDAPRRAREEKGHFRYDRDWKYGINSKSFRMRDCDEDMEPRKRRPS